jgi:hypothetical protein
VNQRDCTKRYALYYVFDSTDYVPHVTKERDVLKPNAICHEVNNGRYDANSRRPKAQNEQSFNPSRIILPSAVHVADESWF